MDAAVECVDREPGFMYNSPVLDPDRPDPLRRMKVYVLAEELVQKSWPDMELVRDNKITGEIVGQMYKSMGRYQRTSARVIRRARAKIARDRLSTPWVQPGRPSIGTTLSSA